MDSLLIETEGSSMLLLHLSYSYNDNILKSLNTILCQNHINVKF